MATKEQIARINALAKKKKEGGLTDAELAEQKELRAIYLEGFRKNFRAQLDNIEIVDLKPEEEYTEEEKAHVAELSQKLEAEFKAGGQGSITEMGNPRKPEGEAGKVMLERMNESHSRLTDWALDLMTYNTDDLILDIGCGGGAALAKLVKKAPGAQFYGIDYSEVAVEASKTLNASIIKAGQMEIHHGSVSSMPFEDGQFTKIISVESYFFWPDLVEDLKEVNRVLSADGQLLLIAEIYDKEGLNDEQKENIKKYNMNNLSIENFKTLFAKAGFNGVKIHLKEGEDWIVAEATKTLA